MKETPHPLNYSNYQTQTLKSLKFDDLQVKDDLGTKLKMLIGEKQK